MYMEMRRVTGTREVEVKEVGHMAQTERVAEILQRREAGLKRTREASTPPYFP